MAAKQLADHPDQPLGMAPADALVGRGNDPPVRGEQRRAAGGGRGVEREDHREAVSPAEMTS